MKSCSKCKEFKSSSEYHKDPTGKNGVKAECKTCFNLRCRKNYMNNREEKLRYAAIYEEEHKSERKEYRIKNKERDAKRSREYHYENSDKINARRCFNKATKKYPACECCIIQDILQFYLVRPSNHQVDHKLCAKLGGTHCLKNLQYLTEEEHIKKGAIERTVFRLIRELTS